MKHLLSVAISAMLSAAAFVSCGNDYDSDIDSIQNQISGIYASLSPDSLYVFTLYDDAYEIRRPDTSLYVGSDGGFFTRGIVYKPQERVDTSVWTVDSVTWREIATDIVAPKPSAPVDFFDSPWNVDQRFEITNWLWIERISPLNLPWYTSFMAVKLSKATAPYPREIKIYLSQRPLHAVYPVTQFGTDNSYVTIDGRSIPVSEAPTVKMKAVPTADGTVSVTRAD